MTVGLAVATANGMLNAQRAGGTTDTVVAGTFVKLHTADPGVAGTTAAAVGSATRVTVAQAASTVALLAMTGTAPLWTNAATTETITHISVWDAITAGNFMYSVLLGTPQPWVAGNTFTLNALGFVLTPIAA